MKYRLLGRTGIRVSEIGIGCEGFSGKKTAGTAEMLDAAMEAGINFMDVYTSDPWLRRDLGAAFARYPRNSWVMQGHFCSAWRDGQYFRTRDPAQTKVMFEELMALMRVEYVDVGMIHYVDDLTDLDGVMNGPIYAYIRLLKKRGVIRSVGLSTHNPTVAKAAVESGEVDVIMMSINPAYDMLPPGENVDELFDPRTFRRPYEGIDPRREELYRLCQAEGVALTVMKPFAGGVLLDAARSPFGRAMTPTQCIRYALDRPGVASVLGGMGSVGEIREAVAYENATPEERDYSEILSCRPDSRFSGHCFYCGHCAPCPVGIPVAAVNKYLDLAQAQGTVFETVADHYRLLPAHGGDCIACGACESRCPFGVPVREKMRQAADLFEK